MKIFTFKHVAVAAAALIALGGCCGTSVPGPLTTGEDTIVSTKYGKIQGYNDAGSIPSRAFSMPRQSASCLPSIPTSSTV